MFLKLMLRIVEVLSNVLVLISQVAALNWSHTIYPNLGYPRQNAENRHFCAKSYLKVFYLLVMFLKLMLRIVEVLSNVLVLISQVAALNWSHTIYPNLVYPRQKRRKSTFLREKLSESTLAISDVLETYVENSWGPKQRFGINQPSGRAQLKSHFIPKLRVPRQNAENRHFCTKSYLRVFYPLVMFLKIMLGMVEVLSNVLVLINQVAALNWSDTIYPNLGYPRQKRRKSTFLHQRWSESILSISDVLETYVDISWGPKQRFGINQPSGRDQLKWHHIPKLRVPLSKRRKSNFLHEGYLRVFYSLVMFLKIMLRIVEVLSNVLVLISQVAALNWSDTIYPNLGYPRQKRRKTTFLHEKWSESILSISDVLETYVENSWVPKQRLVLIIQVAALKWSDTIYPNLRYPCQCRKSTFLREKLSESILYISDVPETYVENSWGPKQRFGINQPSGRAQLKWHHIPKLRVPPSKTPKIDIFARKVIWEYFIY